MEKPDCYDEIFGRGLKAVELGPLRFFNQPVKLVDELDSYKHPNLLDDYGMFGPSASSAFYEIVEEKLLDSNVLNERGQPLVPFNFLSVDGFGGVSEYFLDRKGQIYFQVRNGDHVDDPEWTSLSGCGRSYIGNFMENHDQDVEEFRDKLKEDLDKHINLYRIEMLKD